MKKIEVNIHLYLAVQRSDLFLRIYGYNKLAKVDNNLIDLIDLFKRENYNSLNFDKVTNLLSRILFVKLDRSVLYQFLDDSFECAK